MCDNVSMGVGMYICVYTHLYMYLCADVCMCVLSGSVCMYICYCVYIHGSESGFVYVYCVYV